MKRACVPDRTVSAVVLAAGASRRMGAPKALLPVDGAPLLLAHVAVFRDAGLAVTVVVGAFEAECRAVLPPDVRVLVNRRWADTHPSDSADLALEGAGVVILTPVDVPPAAPATLRRLLAASGDAVPTWAGQDGHPVRLVPPHPAGVRLDVRLAEAERVPVDDPDCVRNLNTPTEWAAWRAARSAGASRGSP